MAHIAGLLSKYVGLINNSPTTNQLIFHFNDNVITSFFLALYASLNNVLRNVWWVTQYCPEGCEQDKQHAYVVILMSVPVTIVAAENQCVLHILSVCL